jgi:hypothetical protein
VEDPLFNPRGRVMCEIFTGDSTDHPTAARRSGAKIKQQETGRRESAGSEKGGHDADTSNSVSGSTTPVVSSLPSSILSRELAGSTTASSVASSSGAAPSTERRKTKTSKGAASSPSVSTVSSTRAAAITTRARAAGPHSALSGSTAAVVLSARSGFASRVLSKCELRPTRFAAAFTYTLPLSPLSPPAVAASTDLVIGCPAWSLLPEHTVVRDSFQRALQATHTPQPPPLSLQAMALLRLLKPSATTASNPGGTHDSRLTSSGGLRNEHSPISSGIMVADAECTGVALLHARLIYEFLRLRYSGHVGTADYRDDRAAAEEKEKEMHKRVCLIQGLLRMRRARAWVRIVRAAQQQRQQQPQQLPSNL